MSEQIKPAEPGETVELKDQETGFYDAETEFKVVRDQQAKLGDTIGKRTHEAIMSGGLLVVGSGKAKAATGAGDGKKPKQSASDLPEDFPGRESFVAAKMNFEQVKVFDFEKDKVEGIGAKTVEAIREYLKKK